MRGYTVSKYFETTCGDFIMIICDCFNTGRNVLLINVNA